MRWFQFGGQIGVELGSWVPVNCAGSSLVGKYLVE
jgi:hypothetical protein